LNYPKVMRRTVGLVLVALALAPAGCRQGGKPIYPTKKSNVIVAGARDQLSWGTRYDARYTKIGYPGGDVPRNRGVCTDVVIRALRGAGYDLQVLVHKDMLQQNSGYPKYGNASGPDTNIDHRRCPNLRRYFERHGAVLTTDTGPANLGHWKPGDIVFWKMFNGLDHVGVVSDVKAADGIPFVIHNAGEPAEEDCLRRWRIVGHFRFPEEGIEAAKPRPRVAE
jgi:uncharacterized protein